MSLADIYAAAYDTEKKNGFVKTETKKKSFGFAME